MKYELYGKNYKVITDEGRVLGEIINYHNGIGWEFAPYVHTRLSYILLRRLHNKVYQLRKRDGQDKKEKE
jgi:hypothetical protein